jgi:hypothetical protein
VTYTTGEFSVNTTTTASLSFQNLSNTYSEPLFGTVKLTDPPAPPFLSPMSLALLVPGLTATSITRRFRSKR